MRFHERAIDEKKKGWGMGIHPSVPSPPVFAPFPIPYSARRAQQREDDMVVEKREDSARVQITERKNIRVTGRNKNEGGIGGTAQNEERGP